MSIFGEVAAGTGMGLVNGAIDLFFGKKKQKLQLEGQKQALQQQNEAQLDLWNKTNYGAQVKHLKEAGLNAGLLYGMSGGGGVTAGAGGAMPSNQEGNSNVAGGAMAMMNLSLLEAQKKVLESQANLNNVNANKAAGVDTEAVKQGIAESIQRIETGKASAEMMKAQTVGNNLDNLFKQSVNPKLLRKIDVEIDNLDEALESAVRNNKIGAATANDIIAQAELRTAGMKLENNLTEAKTKLTGAQEKEALAAIEQRWKELDVKLGQLNLDQKRLEVQKFVDGIKLEFPSIWNVIGKTFNDFFEGVNNAGKRTYGGQSEMPK